MVNTTIPDAHVNGFISNGTTSITFETNASCNTVPSGSISGTVRNVFTGGSILNNFTFSSNSPVLLGVDLSQSLIHILFNNVRVKNTTTGETFNYGKAVLTARRVTSKSFRASITIYFARHTLTFFGAFTGTASPNRQVICQQLL